MPTAAELPSSSAEHTNPRAEPSPAPPRRCYDKLRAPICCLPFGVQRQASTVTRTQSDITRATGFAHAGSVLAGRKVLQGLRGWLASSPACKQYLLVSFVPGLDRSIPLGPFSCLDCPVGVGTCIKGHGRSQASQWLDVNNLFLYLPENATGIALLLVFFFLCLLPL